MARSSLIRDAYKKYKAAPFSSWILGIVTGILIAAILALDFLVPALSFLTIPLLCLPFIFAATLQHIVLNKPNAQITLKSSFKAIGLYFNPNGYMGCFAFFGALLKSVIAFLISEMSISFVASYIYLAFHPDFASSVDSLYALLGDNSFTIEQFETLIHSNNDLLFNYMVICFIPSYFIAFTIFAYNISRRSIVIYYRSYANKLNISFAKIVYFSVLRGKRLEMFGNYMLLNWPMYVLMIAGFTGGSIIGYIWQGDLFFMMAAGLVLGALLSTFFLPFYFGNQEAFYEYYHDEFAEKTEEITKMMLSNIERDIELSTKEKERLEEHIHEPLDDDKESDKKDPEGP